MITLSERLQLELRNRDPSEITELILDNSKANEIEGLDSSYVNLRELSLVNVGLTTLKGFPSLPNLEKLDLSDNKISTGLEHLKPCSKLTSLLLTNNRIKNVKDIECLSSFSQLEILDLFNCYVSFEDNYRKEIFSLVPTLKYLDGFDEKNEEELNESEDYEDEEEVELGTETNTKDIYELTDGSESDEDEDEDEEYETEGEIINHASGKAPNTGGKDMNLYPNEVEISEEELDENADEYDEDEDYDEKSIEEIIETNGKSKVNNYVTESEDDDDDDVDDENENDDEFNENEDIVDDNEEEIVEHDHEEEEDGEENDTVHESPLNGDVSGSLINGIDKSNSSQETLSSMKRKYENAFVDDYNYDEDESCDIKSLRNNNSDFELTDESSLIDKV